eukprot:scaffold37344_cov55-Phaeocystis_antarctica.AAC.1
MGGQHEEALVPSRLRYLPRQRDALRRGVPLGGGPQHPPRAAPPPSAPLHVYTFAPLHRSTSAPPHLSTAATFAGDLEHRHHEQRPAGASDSRDERRGA